MSAKSVLADIDAWLKNLRAELKLAELTDDEYRKRLEADGYLLEGNRLGRSQIEIWIRKLEGTRSECDKRRRNGDAHFFDAMTTYGLAKWTDAYERLERYGRRFGPLIRSRQRSNAAARTARQKITPENYKAAKARAKSKKQLAGFLNVAPATLSRWEKKK